MGVIDFVVCVGCIFLCVNLVFSCIDYIMKWRNK